MEPKDERYDPAVNYDSGSDTELNNAREKYSASPPSSPCGWSDLPVNGCIFIHNDIHSGIGTGRRGGGPLAEKGDSGRFLSKKKCEACGDRVPELHKGYAYACRPCNRKEMYCLDCAIGKKKFRGGKQCKHGSLRKDWDNIFHDFLKEKKEEGMITQGDIDRAKEVWES